MKDYLSNLLSKRPNSANSTSKSYTSNIHNTIRIMSVATDAHYFFVL